MHIVKRLLFCLFFLAAFASRSEAQFANCTQTPNVAFYQPSTGNTGTWGNCYNENFTILDSLLGGVNTLPTNNVSPSIAAGRVWVTGNSSPTAISNLLGGTNGEILTIVANDALTTITSGGNFKLTGTWTSSSSTGITLVYNAGIWIETGRAGGGGGGGGGGSVTTFSAGNLLPLFTTSVANPTTTPALTFALSNASAYTVFANSSAIAAAPSFTTNPAVSSVILEGSVSGSATLSVTSTGGTLNLGPNATVTAAGVLTVTSCINCTTGGVSSVFGRTGAVVASTGDYTIAQLTASYSAPIVLTGTTLSVSNATTGAAGVIQLAGDLGGSASSPSVLQVHGVAFPATGASFDALPILTASNTIGYYQINGGSSCGDATHGLSYSSVTHLLGCQSITGSGGGVNITINGGATLGSPVNFQNGGPVTGITINASNPTGSNVQFAISGTLTDGGLTSAYSGVGACATNTWASTLTRNTAPTCTQPAFSNLSGTIALAQTQLTSTGDLLTVSGGALARLGQGGNGTFLGVSGGILGYYAPSAGSLTFPVTVSGTVTSGGIPYFNSASQMSSSGVLANGDFVLGGGAGGAPTATFSVVPVANGGTGIASGTSGGVLYYSASGTLASSSTLTQYGLMYGGGAGAAPSVMAPPTSNGYYLCGYNVTGGVALAPTCAQPGVVTRPVTGTTSTDTIASTDCNPGRVSYMTSVAVAVTLPTATTLGVPNCVFRIANNTSGSATAVTVTPTTWTVRGSSSIVLAQGQIATFYVDPAGSNWEVDVNDEPIVAGSNITITRGQYGPTVAAAAGTYFQTSGFANTSIAIGTANHTLCSGFVVPPGGLSVGHVAFTVATADGTNNNDFGFYSSAGTLEAHIGAQTIAATGNKTLAFSGGTHALSAGKAYACETSVGTTFAVEGNEQTQTFYSSDIAQSSSGGALLGSITPPADAPATSTTAFAFVLYP